MSNQFAVATALIHGEVAIDHYIDYRDPGINRLTSLAEVVLDDECEGAYPQQRRGRVKVFLDDGTCIEKAKPDLDVVLAPMDHRAIMEKVGRYARDVFGKKKSAQLLRSIEEFSELDDISRLFPRD
jgi:2-methylcitrate dehydratase PrpD